MGSQVGDNFKLPKSGSLYFYGRAAPQAVQMRSAAPKIGALRSENRFPFRNFTPGGAAHGVTQKRSPPPPPVRPPWYDVSGTSGESDLNPDDIPF